MSINSQQLIGSHVAARGIMHASPVIGFHGSHEQHPPSALLEHVRLAADAGFGAAMCSDHFHPWTERQGHAGFAWSWLGSALAATSLSYGTVCAPGQRYHPAVIAQAAATLAEMFPRRFWLALGSGEALNEAITGEPWPDKTVRHARVHESAAVMRALWAGETVSVRGHTTTSSARLYSRSADPPLLLGAALTATTAGWVGSWADGLITAAGSRSNTRAVVDAFREGGGAHKPVFLQVTVSFARTDEESVAAADQEWRQCALAPEQLANLATPAAFDRACADVTIDNVLAHVRASADIQRHIAWLQEDAALGVDRVYLHNVARAHQARFIEACGTHLLPAFDPQPTGDGV
jgi:coenzyme F420-dependent glucose-6-phosphate dehydrogenase